MTLTRIQADGSVIVHVKSPLTVTARPSHFRSEPHAQGHGTNMGFKSRAIWLYYREAEEECIALLPLFLVPFSMCCLNQPDGGAGPDALFDIVWVLGALSPQVWDAVDTNFSLRKTNLILKLSKPGKKCSDGKFFPERSSTKFNHLKENMPQGWQREAGHVAHRATAPAAPGAGLPGSGFPSPRSVPRPWSHARLPRRVRVAPAGGVPSLCSFHPESTFTIGHIWGPGFPQILRTPARVY